KKTHFTGWMNPLRFLIKQEKPEEGEPYFHAWVWPGPYIFDLTDDSLKTDITFPFTQEGKEQTVDWINEQYESRIKGWPRRKTDGC
ncbi:MAG: GNAT family acetyltransferase, partial [Lachnospiraceae bacterium]|nr:GNAT family acetyltransferase [Lachnospiraceae bacterium]